MRRARAQIGDIAAADGPRCSQKFMDAAEGGARGGRALVRRRRCAQPSRWSKRILAEPAVHRAALTPAQRDRDAARITGSMAGLTDLTSRIRSSTSPQQRDRVAVVQAALRQGLRRDKDWRVEVRGVAQAFAQLAQIAGPSLNGVTRGHRHGDRVGRRGHATGRIPGGDGARLGHSAMRRATSWRPAGAGAGGRPRRACGIGLQVGQLGLSRGKSFAGGRG